MKRVHVHIHRLTVDGVEGTDGPALGAAIRRELARMVAGGAQVDTPARARHAVVSSVQRSLPPRKR